MKVAAIPWLFVFMGYCQAQPQSKQAYMTCILNEQSGSLDLTFNLALNAEPQGVLTPINNIEYNKSPRNFSRLQGCSVTYENNAYRLETSIDSSGVESNLCDAVIIKATNGEVSSVQLLLLYTNDDDDLLMEMDRLYIATCLRTDALPNVVSTVITVTTPNLNAGVPILQPDVTLSVVLGNSGPNYQTITSAPAGTLVRLMLTLTREQNFDPDIHVFGAYLYRAYAWFTQTPGIGGKDLLIDKDACAYSGDPNANTDPGVQVPPFPAAHGPMGAPSSSGQQYNSVTGPFYLWKYRPSNVVYFFASFDIFNQPDSANLAYPCLYKTGAANRKRRSEQPMYEMTISTSIAITSPESDDETPATDSTSSRQLAIMVGAISGAVIVMLIAGFVCLFAVLTSRRRMRKNPEDFRTSSTVSIVPHDKR